MGVWIFLRLLEAHENLFPLNCRLHALFSIWKMSDISLQTMLAFCDAYIIDRLRKWHFVAGHYAHETWVRKDSLDYV